MESVAKLRPREPHSDGIFIVENAAQIIETLRFNRNLLARKMEWEFSIYYHDSSLLSYCRWFNEMAWHIDRAIDPPVTFLPLEIISQSHFDSSVSEKNHPIRIRNFTPRDKSGPMKSEG